MLLLSAHPARRSGDNGPSPVQGFCSGLCKAAWDGKTMGDGRPARDSLLDDGARPAAQIGAREGETQAASVWIGLGPLSRPARAARQKSNKT
eukprot:4549934-Prorocentrum_lima.AAC.1